VRRGNRRKSALQIFGIERERSEARLGHEKTGALDKAQISVYDGEDIGINYILSFAPHHNG
jgi:hypothetical protein